MNRTQAKARADELGISKEVARSFGNLNKTQTWLDAISAHKAQMQIQDTADTQPGLDVLQTECERPTVDEQPMQTDAIAKQASEGIASNPTSPVAIAPIFPDPWNELDEAPERLATTPDRGESQPLYSVSEIADVVAESKRPDARSWLGDRQALAPESFANRSETVPPKTPVYPFLILCLAIWAVLWVTGQLLVGLGLCLKLGLTYWAKQFNSVMNERLEPAQQPEGPGVGAESVRSRLRSKLPKESPSPQPPRTAIP